MESKLSLVPPPKPPLRRAADVAAWVLLPIGLWLIARAANTLRGVVQPSAGDTIRFIAARDLLFALAFAAPATCIVAWRIQSALGAWRHLRRRIEADARLTTRRCPHCRKPCPRYRLTCRYCRRDVGREA